jgi:outer membrane autotransporter protein
VGDLDGGYDFHVKNWTFGPLAGAQYTHLDVNSFSEDGADVLGADESVSKQETDSLRSRLGGHVNYAFQTGTVVLTPHLDASWQHEFMDHGEGINAQIVNVVGAPFTVTTPNPSRDSALIDCGLNADLNGQITVFGDYLIQAGQSNYFGQSVQAGVKVGF